MKHIRSLYTLFLGLFNFFKFRIYDVKKINKANIVFILPYYHTGGAEKVHLNIVKALRDQKCCVIFTHLSATKNHYEDFKKYAAIIELNAIRNKNSNIINRLLKNAIIKTLNTSKTIHTVFGCNTDFFYKLVPYLKKDLIKIDLLHALSDDDNSTLSFVNTADIIDFRVCINQKAKEDLILIYNHNNLNQDYTKRIRIIENGVAIPKVRSLKIQPKQNITFGFIGRWSDEKRPELFLEVAKHVKAHYPKVAFVMAGTGMKSNLKQINDAGVSFLGEITNPNKLNTLYKSLTGIIITSKYEGFPMVIMESMIFGVVPLSTNVGGISQHIAHFKNGIMVDATTDDAIVKAFTKHISFLIENTTKTQQLANAAQIYGVSNFSIDKFNVAYQNLFNSNS
ncbi:glycosyltransferase family 4 protein [Winogradskyella sp.]|uniref:glycosyltransferase family 4 protein n=1 Tax=Winogradskyella sp. TaxID=1883156 RepID=UPI003AB7CDE7